MSHYQRQLLLSASPAAVYQAIATQAGLRGWWTHTCDADSHVGGRATFQFNQSRKVMNLTSLVPEREVRWQCAEAYIDADFLQHKDEWVGTQIVFKLAPTGDGGTRLDFEHLGLSPALQCFDICTSGWNQFMGSLQSYVETGTGQPFTPADTCSAHHAAQ